MSDKTRLDLAVINDTITRPANATAYVAGDVIAEVTTNDPFTFVNCVNAGFLSGVIEAARIYIESNPTTKPDLELWLFDTAIVEVADNGAFAVTDDELDNLIGIIDFPIADWKVGLSGADAAGNIVQYQTNLALPFELTSADARDIIGQLVVRNAYTPIASEVFNIELIIAKD